VTIKPNQTKPQHYTKLKSGNIPVLAKSNQIRKAYLKIPMGKFNKRND